MSLEAAEVYDAAVARLDEAGEKLKAAEASLSEVKARADETEERIAAMEADLESARSDEAIKAAVDERVGLIESARRVLGEGFEGLDKMDAAEIHEAVILKVFPGAAEKIKGAEPAYIKARFDSALEASNPLKTESKKVSDRTDAMTARGKMIERNRSAWRGSK